MSQHLETATRRERMAKMPEQRDPFALEGVALAREIRAAMRSVPAARVASEPEREALAQMAAERILRKRSRGSARDVIAWIDRAERMPVTAAREQRERVERGATGRAHLVGIIASLCAQSRDWLDTTERYRTRAQSQADTGPMIAASLDAATDPETGEPTGFLARAVAREGGARLAPLSVDRLALAALLARESVPAERTERERESVRLALLANLPDPQSGEPVAGPALAASEGVAYGTLRNRISEGARLWRALYPDPRDAAAVVRAAAESLALERGERSRVARGDAPHLDLAGVSALAAIGRAQTEQSKRTRAYLSGSRGAYSPATLSAARRNLRAAMRTGRYGRALPARRPLARGGVAILSRAPDPRMEAARALARRERERVRLAARRDYYLAHPCDWTREGAEQAERAALR